jgi:hypothetical protein
VGVEFLVALHSFWRWAVLMAGVVAVVGAAAGWLGALPPAVAARRAGTLYVAALDFQLLIGIVLWVIEQRWLVPGYFRFEHPTIMILAVVAAHVGVAMARRAKVPTAAARTVAVGTLVSLVLVIVGIPGVVRGA